MRNISHFFTKQSLSYLIWIPTVFSILKNPQQFIKSYISWNLTISELTFRNWYVYPIKNFDDLWVFYEIFVKKEYWQIWKDDKNIIDIGANNGLFMLYCKRQNPDCNIYCFEPVPACANNIRSLIEINKLQNVYVQEIALSDSEWEQTLFLDNQTIAATLHKDISANSNGITVTSSTLPHQTDILGIKNIDILKMDCEWSEYEIIESLSPEFLQSCKKIMIEWHNIDTIKNGEMLFKTIGTKISHNNREYKKHLWHWNNGFIKIYNS